MAKEKMGGLPDPDIRRRLLDCTTELFVQKGYAATSVREIVAAAGVTPPVLYYYFHNKEGLFLEIMGEAGAQFHEELSATMELDGTAREKLTHLFLRIYALIRKRIQAARLMHALYYGPPQGAPEFECDRFHTLFRESVLSPVKQGIRDGEFAAETDEQTAETMMWALLGAMQIAMEMELCHPDKSLCEQGLRRVLDWIFRGIRHETMEGRENT